MGKATVGHVQGVVPPHAPRHVRRPVVPLASGRHGPVVGRGLLGHSAPSRSPPDPARAPPAGPSPRSSPPPTSRHSRHPGPPDPRDPDPPDPVTPVPSSDLPTPPTPQPPDTLRYPEGPHGHPRHPDPPTPRPRDRPAASRGPVAGQGGPNLYRCTSATPGSRRSHTSCTTPRSWR